MQFVFVFIATSWIWLASHAFKKPVDAPVVRDMACVCRDEKGRPIELTPELLTER